MNKLSLAITAVLFSLVTACSTYEPQSEPEKTNLPEGVVSSSSGKMFIELETPVDGCKAYRQYSPGGMVIQVIYFKHKDNTFSPNREGAICP